MKNHSGVVRKDTIIEHPEPGTDNKTDSLKKMLDEKRMKRKNLEHH